MLLKLNILLYKVTWVHMCTLGLDPEPINLKYDIAKVNLLWNFNLDFTIFDWKSQETPKTSLKFILRSHIFRRWLWLNCCMFYITLDLLCRRFILKTNVVHTFLNGGIKTEQPDCSCNSDWSFKKWPITYWCCHLIFASSSAEYNFHTFYLYCVLKIV